MKNLALALVSLTFAVNASAIRPQNTSLKTTETFKMYSSPDFKVNPGCDIHTKLTIDYYKMEAHTTLALDGFCEIAIRPNPRTYKLTMSRPRCGNDYVARYEGTRETPNGVETISISDSRRSIGGVVSLRHDDDRNSLFSLRQKEAVVVGLLHGPEAVGAHMVGYRIQSLSRFQQMVEIDFASEDLRLIANEMIQTKTLVLLEGRLTQILDKNGSRFVIVATSIKEHIPSPHPLR